MKKNFILFIALLWALGTNIMAQNGGCRITSDDWQSLRLEIITPELNTGTTMIDGQKFTTLSMEGFIPSGMVGAPETPIFSRLIEVPQCDGFNVTVRNAQYDTIILDAQMRVVPAQPSRSKSDTTTYHPLTINKKIYTTDALFGFESASVENVGIARDRHLARLQFSPIRYNPVNGQLIVCRRAEVEVRYIGADEVASMTLFNRYYSPYFSSGALVMNSLYPKSVSTTAPIRYLIVAHSSFQGQLDSFVQWKRRKGFITDIVYTGATGVGTTSTSISTYIQSQYTNATTTNPAPTYLLIVGDHEQIPAFTGASSSDHITDLYYVSWTSGDNIPDCYCGRFSAQTVAQLTPQIQKTLMYEQYTFADPSFLDRAVLVAGVDGGSSGDYGYTHADPAMDYAATHYINSTQGFTQVQYFKNNTSSVPSATGVTIGSCASSNSATVRSYYNQGAGWINYSAHGSATSWGTPNFTTTHVSEMTNTQKFGLMIGNCCLTNKFETTTCLGEALLRKAGYCGAVGYIGGSNSTYWNEDFYWAVGLRSGISATMSLAYNASNLGAYDRLCHTHGEQFSQWALSQGSIMMVGNLAVESSSSSRKLYYWEIYHLMGDPSVMPYLTQAAEMSVSAPSIITAGTTSINVAAAPYAYVAMTDTSSHSIVAATFTDNSGNAVISFPTALPVGGYELAISAQQYRTSFSPISVIQPEGPFPVVTSATALSTPEAGDSTTITLAVSNLGNSTATSITVSLSTADSNDAHFTPAQFIIDSILPGDTTWVTTLAHVAANVQDGTSLTVSSMTSFNGSDQPNRAFHIFNIIAPTITIELEDGDISVLPGDSVNIVAHLHNSGHATLNDDRLSLCWPTRLLTTDATLSDTTDLFSLAPGNSTSFNFMLHADSLLPEDINVPMTLNSRLATLAFNVFVGVNTIETFESNTWHTTGWSQGSYPWSITNSGAHAGNYCLRSTSTLTHNQTAETNVSVSINTADSITFYYKVSSEANYDKFHFLIDGNELLTQSGEVEWTRAAYLVPAGNHTLSFTYSKDGSVNRNSDCAWIDDIRLPHMTSPVDFQNIDLCAGSLLIIADDTINTDSDTVASHVANTGTGFLLVDYSVHPNYTTWMDTAVCDSFAWADSTYTMTDDLHYLFSTVYGCDSLVECHLTVHYSANDTIIDTVYSDSFMWGDTICTQSGTYLQNLMTEYGCDSIVTLMLTLIDTTNTGIGEDIPSLQVSVYPNPTKGMLHFDRNVNEAVIYDATGRVMLHRLLVNELDLTDLPNGIYLLRSEGVSMTIIKK